MAFRSNLSRSISLYAVLVLGAAPALAQGQSTDEKSAAQASDAEDIVVTAQRRAERLIDVPVAVTAVTSETLLEARVTNIANITAISPSITFVSTNNPASTGNIQIRGIGTVGSSPAFEGAVGVFVDGVYRSRSGQVLANFLDIADLQIVRGPQGTLFGKNTSAGAVLLSSTQPSLTQVSANFEATVANYDTKLLRAGFSVPVSDKFGIRVAATYGDRSGFIRNPTGGSYGGGETWGVKAQAFWEPTEAIRFRLIGDYVKSNENCCYATVDAVDGPTQPLINLLSGQFGNPPVNGKPLGYRQALSQDTVANLRDRGVVLTGEFDVGGDTLTSITAYRLWDTRQQRGDTDYSGADIFSVNDNKFRNRQFSQELLYNGKIGSSAEYVLGAYFSSERNKVVTNFDWGGQAQFFFDTILAPLGFPAGFAQAPVNTIFKSDLATTRNESYGVFTHWTVQVNEKLSLISGGRYSWDRKFGSYTDLWLTNTLAATNPVFTLLGGGPGPSFSGRNNNGALSGTLGLRYQFGRDATAYLTYSRGYKSGGINIDPTAAGSTANNPALDGTALDPTPGIPNLPKDPSYQPEKIDGYEAGLKLRWLDGRATTNFAAFYNDISNLQVAQFLGLEFAILSSKSAKVYGAEIENAFQLSDSLKLELSGTWLPKANFGTDPAIGGLSGRRFSLTPKFAGNAALSLDQPVTDKLAFTSRVAVRYFGKNFTNPSNNFVQPAYTQLDANIGLKSIDNIWKVSVYCSNCTDKRYLVQHFNTPLQPGDSNAFIGAPRQFGVTLSGTF